MLVLLTWSSALRKQSGWHGRISLALARGMEGQWIVAGWPLVGMEIQVREGECAVAMGGEGGGVVRGARGRSRRRGCERRKVCDLERSSQGTTLVAI